MSKSKLSPAARKGILSSVATAGAAPLVQGKTVSQHQIAKSLVAAVALLAVDQSADAGSIVVQNANVTVGLNSSRSSFYPLNLNTGNPGGLKSIGMALLANSTLLGIIGSITTANPNVNMITSNSRPLPVGFGVTWNQAGTVNAPLPIVVQTTKGGNTPFTDEYYLFYFVDSNSDKHYGWMLGTLTSSSYHLTSYAYDTAANVTIAAGDTGATVPEPSSLALGAMGALVLGAAGVRKWKKDRQPKAV